jgi:hypothetical protein
MRGIGTRRMVLVTLAGGVGWLATLGRSLRGETGACCARCGCAECELVCRLEPDTRKVETTCWGVKYEEFCVSGPSCRGERVCEEACCPDDGKPPEAGKNRVETQPKVWRWWQWSAPKSARVFTRAKLMKKSVTKSVPGYKWVLEPMCPTCVAALEQPTVEAVADVPPLPELPEGTRVVPASHAGEPRMPPEESPSEALGGTAR